MVTLDFDPEPYKSMPDNEPEEPEASIKKTVLQVNSNMGTMTMLLGHLVKSSCNRPTGLVQTMPTGQNLEIPTGNSLGQISFCPSGIPSPLYRMYSWHILSAHRPCLALPMYENGQL